MTILDNIVSHVREETARKKRDVSAAALRDRPLFAEPRRGFAVKLAGKGRSIVAEIKRASPSKGLIRQEFDPVSLAHQFSVNGASALSVLTETRFFQGSLESVEQIRRSVGVPLLRKDFILESYQVIEARSFGADAMLLIAALLDRPLLEDLRSEAEAVGLDVLVEVHTEAELDIALGAGCRLVGINNRDLRTFRVDLETTERLAPRVPAGIPVVCESGIEGLEQIEKLEKLGVHRFLIGETLMRAPDPGAKLRELLGDRQQATGNRQQGPA
jgi:indole-3-glycerol phosphate synthase